VSQGKTLAMRRLVTILVAAAVVLGGCADDDTGVDPEAQSDETPADCEDVSSAQGSPAPITMKDNFYEPVCLAVSSTQPITFTNAGNATHNFSIEDQGVDIDVAAGEELTTEPVGDLVRPGNFRFFCKYHERDGMVGTIIVE
jgi:plastocyanin